jgi:hypothetical protein
MFIPIARQSLARITLEPPVAGGGFRANGLSIPLHSACHRRPGERIASDFGAVHFGRYWHKADIPHRVGNVRFSG